jgi:hypothetical protein
MISTGVSICGSSSARTGKLARVGADVARRLDEAVAVVGGEVVLPDFPVPHDAPWRVLAPPGRVKKGGAQMSTTMPEQDSPLLRLPKRSSRT